MKTLLVIMACGISVAGSLIMTNTAVATNDTGSNIHIDQSRQFPETRWANADHYLRIHVPRNSAAMSALLLQVPENLRFDTSQVEVFDPEGQKLPVTFIEGLDSQVSPAARMIELNFVTPVANGRQVELRIKNVQKILVSRPSTYSISAKLTGSDQERYVGEAYFRSY